MAEDRLLRVRLRSVFVVDDKGTHVRWGPEDKDPAKDKIPEYTAVGYAQVRIPKYHRLAENLTSPTTGETRININGIINPFVVEIYPPAVSLSDQPAGPLLGPPGLPKSPNETPLETMERQWAEALFVRMNQRRYRPFEVEVFPEKGYISYLLRPKVLHGATHARVIRHAKFQNKFLDIDWKPDWMSIPTITQLRESEKLRKEGQSLRREDVPIYRADDTDRKPIAAASDLLASGNWVILIHRTTVNIIGSTLNEFINNWQSKGVHYIIDVDGHIVKLTDDRTYMTRHAGPSQWGGKAPVNAFSIGIELVNKTGERFTHAQMASLLRLVDQLRKTYKISRDRVLAHGEVRNMDVDGTRVSNPRENCPGFEFDWTILEKNGHATYPTFREDITLPPGFDEFFLSNTDDALMYPNSDKDGGKYGKANKRIPSGRNDLIIQLQRNLIAIGYERPPPKDDGEFSAYTEKLLRRFQARYMTGARETYLGDKHANLGKANLYTIVMMRAVLTAQGQQWRIV